MGLRNFVYETSSYVLSSYLELNRDVNNKETEKEDKKYSTAFSQQNLGHVFLPKSKNLLSLNYYILGAFC